MGITLISCNNGEEEKIYIHIGITVDVVHSFASPESTPKGLSSDGTNLISSNWAGNLIYVHVRVTSTISDTFKGPGGIQPAGLGYDGSNLLSCDPNPEKIYQHDGISGDVLSEFASPGTRPAGLSFDGSNLISSDRGDEEISIHNGISAGITSSFASPGTYPSGLGFDGTNLISCDRDTNKIYIHVGVTSTIADDFATPDSSCEGLTTLEGGSAPTAPTALLCEQQTNPSDVVDMVPEFSAVYNDPDSGDTANAYEIHLATTEAGLGTPDKWDSEWIAIRVDEGNRCGEIEYEGSDLSINQTYYWKIRFRDSWNLPGAWSAVANFSTGWFENWGERQVLVPVRRFIYDDIIETARVESFGIISRASDSIISGGTAVVLINSDKYWNKFIADRSNVRREAKLQLGIGVLNTIARAGIARSGITAANLVSLGAGSVITSGIYLAGQGEWQDVFTGWGDDPEFIGSRVTLPLRDKFAGLFEKDIGSKESSVKYYSASYNPADLAWAILVTYGGLDSTASVDNTDIDYATWSAWKTACATASISLEAEFKGGSIRDALELIRDLSNSDIYVAGDGKMKFYRFSPAAVPGSAYHFDEDRYDNNLRLRLDSEKIINYVRVYYGYDPSAETWAGNSLAQDTQSQLPPPDGYGLCSETIESKVVWHASSASAAAYGERRIVEFAEPLEIMSLRSYMMGMRTDIGDVIRISRDILDYVGDYFRVRRISALDLGDGSIELEAGVFHDITVTALELMEYSTDALAQAAYVSSISASPTPQLWSRLESPDDVVTPQAGVGGDVAGNPSWSPHKFGNGYWSNVGIGARFPTAANNINGDKGTIEFWHRVYIEPAQFDRDAYLFSCWNVSPAGGLYCAWLLAGHTLYVQAGTNIVIAAWEFDRNAIYHFGITWDRTGTDIGGGKTLMLKVDNVEIGSSTETWAAGMNINPYIYLSTDHNYQRFMYGGMDNFKTYNVCKTDFSDKDIEDPNYLQCYSESTIRQQGSYSLKIFAQITNSLNETLTRTVSPVIDLSNLVEIRFQVRASRTGSNFKISIRDSGSTVTEYTPNILVADTWQEEKWSILGIDNADKDAINRIQITITNADASNTIYIDKMQVFS